MEENPAPPAPLPTPEPPRSVADIPGLGPIRIRALQKAGWTSLKELRDSSVEALCMSVPGMTPIKAQYILDYLRPFSNQALKPPKPPKLAVAEPAQDALADVAPLLRLCVDVLYRIAMLYDSLLEEEARPKLLREMKQIAANADILAYSKELSAEQREKAEGCLMGICQQIDDSRRHRLNKKAQNDLYENLAPYASILAELL